MKPFYLAMALISLLSASMSAMGYGTNVFINGRELNPAQLMTLQQQLGTYIVPGYYRVNPQTGCWVNLTTEASGCVRGGSPADRWVSPEELTRGGLRGVRPGPLSTYDFVR